VLFREIIEAHKFTKPYIERTPNVETVASVGRVAGNEIGDYETYAPEDGHIRPKHVVKEKHTVTCTLWASKFNR
jgi:hypothetical protein